MSKPVERSNSTKRSGKILSWLEAGTHIATAIGVMIAAVAVIVGYWQWQKGQDFEQEKKAVELLIKYDELMKEPAASGADKDAKLWRENLTMVIAESIFRLRRGDAGWEKTVREMVKQHADFLKTGFLDCDTLDKKFIRIVNEELQQDVCGR